MKGGRWTDREACRHNRETNRRDRQTGWQEINQLKTEGAVRLGRWQEGEIQEVRTLRNIQKEIERVIISERGGTEITKKKEHVRGWTKRIHSRI